MSAHTRGPWRVSGISDKNGGDYVVSAGKFAIASVHNGVDWTPAAVGIPASRQQRNARLIAAAPELLEALQGMLDQPETPESYAAMVDRAVTAIAKATGAA